MPKRKTLPTALSIAGSDSGGGAGVQADMKAFTALGTHGTSVVSCLTAQNPQAVLGVQPATTEMLRLQLEAVFAGFPVKAVKTGMLYSKSLIDAAAAFLRDRKGIPLVVDPVMVSTSGAHLLKQSAIQALREELLPLASLITPNLHEARILHGGEFDASDLNAIKDAARTLAIRIGTSVLIKGGHGESASECVDVLSDGRRETTFRSPRIHGVSIHGAGCALSAAIAAGLAKGLTLKRSIQKAKDYIADSIRHSYYAGTQTVLGVAVK